MYEAVAFASAAVLVVNFLLAALPLPRLVTPILYLTAGVATLLYREDVVLVAAVAGFSNVLHVVLLRLAATTTPTDTARIIRSNKQIGIPRL